MNEMPRLKKLYREKYVQELKDELKLENPSEVPNLSKIIVNVGLGEAVGDKGAVEEVTNEITQITGQKPVETLARRAISAFQIRKGDVVGLKVTFRGA